MRYPWFRVEKADSAVNPDEAYDSHRNQYHSTLLLGLLEKRIEGLRVRRLLGVAEFDLYVPGMNFVFGEARCPGRVGVISTYRLRPPSSDLFDLYQERVVKEAVHEIGHMLGLRHCSDELCVMHFSERLLDTDRKQAELCRNCESKLRMLEV
jgi:archaemetzincin